MRRKSTRNTRKSSPEKTKADSPMKTRKQSSRRRKRSSSKSSEESEEAVIRSDITEPSLGTSQSSHPSDEEKVDVDSKNYSSSEIGKGNQSSSIGDDEQLEQPNTLEKNVSEDFQEQDEEIQDKEDKIMKGKSKVNSNTKIEQSSNNIEPETESDNVQGTPQSPSKDNADSENVVQNVNDTSKSNPEEVEEVMTKNEEEKNLKEETEKEEQEKNFVSEYSQDIVSSWEEIHNSKEVDSDKNTSDHQSENKVRSNTPETVSKNERKSPVSISDQARRKSVSDDNKEKTSKKKITLRRSPPENKENEVSDKPEEKTHIDNKSMEETEQKENKFSNKKIVLKRSTNEDRTSISEEKADGKSELTLSRGSSVSEEFVEKRRRLSSLTEDKGQDSEDRSKKVLKRIKLNRNFSQEDIKLQSRQRHKWGKSEWLNNLSSTLYKIDVESLKIVCPNVQFLGENEVKLEPNPKERRKSESDLKRKMSIDNKSEESDWPDYEKHISEDSSGELKIELNPNIIAMNRKISIVDDTASKLRPPPSPAKHPTADVLYITNLVRPFTVKQLKELLERTGKIKEGGFWTDRIKSKCYVHYESVEEAEATRNALHGVNWPIGNGKKLIIDYATVEDLERAKNPAPVPVVVPEKPPEKSVKEAERTEDKYKEKEKEERKRRDMPIREWDLGKENMHKGRSRSKSRERARKHSRRSYTPDGYIKKKPRKTEEPVPQKLMDDLFLKTKATPSIYWQPLSPEEIATKQQQRLVRMEEHKRRIEENRGRARESRRAPFRRR